MTDQAKNNEDWLNNIDNIIEQFGMKPEDSKYSLQDKRRGKNKSRQELLLDIVEDQDGVIRFENRIHNNNRQNMRRGRNRPFSSNEKVIKTSALKALQPSKVYKALEVMDQKLTPRSASILWEPGDDNSGLLQLQNGAFLSITQPKSSGKILLLIHGTFSNADSILQGLNKTEYGKSFLGKVCNRDNEYYDQVLAFDHRTLGVSPMVNARQLGQLFDNSTATVDIICHSRGGLVARWWAEVFDKQTSRVGKIIFVAAPMNGTSLASPANMRSVMNMFANYSKVIKNMPFGAVSICFFRIINSLTTIAAKTPAIDAAIALIPGFDAMSRISNNHQIISQRNTFPKYGNEYYYAVTSNFSPTAVKWGSLKIFVSSVGKKTGAKAADLVFQSPNDLIVDTSSMTNFHDSIQLPKENIQDFGESEIVHHTNYFEQRQTVEFLSRILGIV